ncbi:MAG: M20 aminoacylase family protein [Alphaproteobacteria bacterium]
MLLQGVIPEIVSWKEEITHWRQDIHAHPETAFEEERTSAVVAQRLEAFGIPLTKGLAKTGVVGVIEGTGGNSEKSILLRADMDALNLQEETTHSYRSTHSGKMHACGHDGHTTMLLAAARYLSAHRHLFAGRVYLVFQPAEEGFAGARKMIEEGLFTSFPADSVWGMHNWPDIPFGKAAVHHAAVMASADRFTITIRGKGSHAAMPHQGIDPVMVSAYVITALQTLVSRRINPCEAAVLSITQMKAGSAFNIIPEEAVLCGTIRAFDEESRLFLEQQLHHVSQQVAIAFGAEAMIDYWVGYPPTVNSRLEADISLQLLSNMLGAENVQLNPPPSMGAEDFSYMLKEKPGSYIWLGQGDANHKAMLHHPCYDFNDALLPIGASYWVKLVETLLPV